RFGRPGASPEWKPSPMISDSLSERLQLAQKLVSAKQEVALAITDEFFLNHPEWTARYGERGRQFCTADACFHVDFLAGSLEADSPEAFADYMRWTARMLGARGISAHTLEENLGQLEKHLFAKLPAKDRDMVLTFLTRGREACAEPPSAPDAPSTGEGLALTRQVFLAAILSGQRPAALNIVEEANPLWSQPRRYLCRCFCRFTPSCRQALGTEPDHRCPGAHGNFDHAVCHCCHLPTPGSRSRAPRHGGSHRRLGGTASNWSQSGRRFLGSGRLERAVPGKQSAAFLGDRR